jgi:hypothetical protein
MIDNTVMLRISDNVIGTRVEDEVVLLNFDAGKYFGLKGVAARMWELLEGGTTVDAIVAVLMEEFDAPSAAVARADVCKTLERLLQEELIREG